MNLYSFGEQLRHIFPWLSCIFCLLWLVGLFSGR